MEKRIGKFVYWTPRFFGILFVLFLMMFSLDVFNSGLTFWQIIIGLFIHNIPALILLFVLIISWKYEIVGGIIFILAGLFYTVMLIYKTDFQWYMISSLVLISFPSFITGILFMICWLNKRKTK